MKPRFRLARRLALVAAALPFAACQGTTAPEGAGDAAREAPVDGAAAPAPAAPSIELIDPGVPGDPMGVTVHRLANGLTVMLSENHEEPRIDAWITVRAGGAKDPPDTTGMAHYLEHMQFKGTPKLGTMDWAAEKPHLDRITAIYDELFRTTDPEKRRELYAEIDRENQAASQYAVPNEFDKLYDAMGARGVNANTDNDRTNYVVNLPSNRVEQWAMLETERLREPVYRLFQSEIEAVYEEKNQTLDSAGRATFEALMGAAFPNHPYGTQTVIGTVEHLKNPSVTNMYAFFHRWYVPGNMCVEMAGDFDKAEVLAILERTLGTLPAKPFPEDEKHVIAPPQGVKRVEVRFKGEETVQLAWVIPPETHPDHDALVLCDMMLGNGKTGLIDVNLNQKQRTRNAGCQPVLFLDGGLQLLVASPKQGQSLDELESLLLEQVELLKQGAFSEEDLDAVITEFEIQEKRSLESNQARVAQMLDAFIERMPWERKVHAIDRLKKLHKADVVAAAREYLSGNYVALRRIDAEVDLPKIQKPNFTAVPIDASRHSDWYREVLSMSPPPIEPKFVVKGRDVEVSALRSGTLVHTRNPMNDVFDLTFTVPVGTDTEPRLSLAFSLLDFAGAGDLDGVALKRRLYALGSTISAGASRDECTISVSGLESNLAATVDLLRQHFEQPTGAVQPVLGMLVGRVLKGRETQKQSKPMVARALGAYALRGAESEFLRQPSNQELQSWKAEDLVAAARDVWRWRRTVSYVGQLSPEQVAAVVDLPPVGGTFEQMADAPPRKPVAYVSTGKNRILFVDQAMAQSHLQVTTADGTYDPDGAPTQRIYNETMSGSMSGIVFQELRESRSLSYDPFAMYITPAWAEDQNFLLGSMRTQADKTAESVLAMTGLLRDWPVTQTRFDSAVESIDLGYRTNRLGFRRTPGVWNVWMHQGYDGDPRPRNFQRLHETKLEDVVAWAKRFGSLPFTVAITGPRDKIDFEQLKSVGEVQELKVDELFAW